jgi:hypothetical protein
MKITKAHRPPSQQLRAERLRRWCRAWPRRAGMLAVMAGLVLLAAACGGSSGSTGATGSGGSSNAGRSTNSQMLTYARCMRSHGLPSFPDPDASGGFGDAGRSQQSNPHFGAADNACRHLLPNGSRQNKGEQNVSSFLRHAQCMRTHGVPNYPDPHPGINPRTALQQSGINMHSPQFQAASRTCDRLLPARGGS